MCPRNTMCVSDLAKGYLTTLGDKLESSTNGVTETGLFPILPKMVYSMMRNERISNVRIYMGGNFPHTLIDIEIICHVIPAYGNDTQNSQSCPFCN